MELTFLNIGAVVLINCALISTFNFVVNTQGVSPQKINTQNSAPVVFRTFEDRVITQKMVNRIQLQQGQRDVQELKNNCLFSG